MKKIILPLICCLLAIIACSSSSSSETEVSVNEIDSTAAINPETIRTDDKVSPEEVEITSENKLSVSEQVLLDRDGIVITLNSFETDGFWGPALKILVENNGTKSVIIQTRNSAVNGIMVLSLFSCDVAAGKKANDEIVFEASSLKIASISVIKDIEFNFVVLDSETYNTIFETDKISITTSANPSYVQTYDDSGFVALNQNGIKIVIKKLDSEDSFWGADIFTYIENNSNDNVMIQIRDMSVNGFMIDPFFSSDVLSGKKAFGTITFMEADLIDNNIETIDSLEFYFTVFDVESWNTIFDSSVIKISFSE